jgi:hypothetical protein
MSPRTALLAGLVIGLTVVIGVVGAIAWRSGVLDTDAPDTGSVSTIKPDVPMNTPVIAPQAQEAGAPRGDR